MPSLYDVKFKDENGVVGTYDLVPAAFTNVAPAYDSTATYAVGDLVIHDHKLYKCVTAIPTAEAWTAAHWTEIDVEEYLATEKASIDGYYDGMTVGNAEQLISSVYSEDNAAYNFRTTGGSKDVGNRLYDKIIGGSLAWNQLTENGDFSSGMTGWAVPSPEVTAAVVDGRLVLTPNATATSMSNYLAYRSIPTIPAGHKVLITYVAESSIACRAECYIYGSSITGPKSVSIAANAKTVISTVVNATSDANRVYARFKGIGSENDSFAVQNYQCFDLTAMFGTTIADYIYTLEQANVGEGVAFFKKLFPKGYYAYNSGEIMSVNTSAHVTTGFNLYNHAIGTAKLVGGKQCQITGAYTAVSYEDINGNAETLAIDADGYFTPAVDGVLTVTGGNATDTCVHLVWSGYRDDEWEDFSQRTYSLDSSLTLRGIPMLNASNELTYDGDVYAADGTVIRRYGIVDMGTLTWTVEDSLFKSSVIANKKEGNANIWCGNGYAIYLSRYSLEEKGIAPWNSGNAKSLGVKDSSYESAEAFKTAMNGVYLIYELATPTTESATPYQELQICDDFGTEAYIDAGVAAGTRDVAIPVGHETRYLANLRDKLQHLPEPADSDGDYLVKRENGVMTLVPYMPPTGLPTAPAEDGTYTLKCTVADGEAVYSWEVTT